MADHKRVGRCAPHQTPAQLAAQVAAQHKGCGRQKHVHVRWLWVEDKVLTKDSSKEATIKAVSMPHNLADTLTEPVASTTMIRNRGSTSFEFRQSWAALRKEYND
eukprot:4578998-Amphidinium_carterae.3